MYNFFLGPDQMNKTTGVKAPRERAIDTAVIKSCLPNSVKLLQLRSWKGEKSPCSSCTPPQERHTEREDILIVLQRREEKRVHTL